MDFTRRNAKLSDRVPRQRAQQTDDYGLAVGQEGLRRFDTGGGSGVLLGLAGHGQWARDERARGKTVPKWSEGKPYSTESKLTPQQVVERLIEGG